jgi:hypothetical protein
MSELRFNVGGFTISMHCPGNDGAVMLPAAYTDFLSEKAPDVFLKVHPESVFSHGSREKIFHSGPNWRLFRSGEKYIVRTMFQEGVFDPDFCSGDLYALRKRGNLFNFQSFAYPLHEILTIHLLCRDQGLLLHACGIVDRGDGILFCGMSGGGKSTLANIWQEQTGNIVLSDDRVIVRMNDGCVTAFGTPWHGEAGHASPAMARLRRIFFIEHAEKNWVKKLSRTEIVSYLIARSFPPLWDRDGMMRTLEFADILSQTIPCYGLGFVPDDRIIGFVRDISGA